MIVTIFIFAVQELQGDLCIVASALKKVMVYEFVDTKQLYNQSPLIPPKVP